MLPKHYRNSLQTYNSVVSELKKFGIQVKEMEGYSDAEYQFIGAFAPDEEEIWIFTAEDMIQFVVKAEIFLRGCEFMNEIAARACKDAVK